jgi:hypothetical protein
MLASRLRRAIREHGFMALMARAMEDLVRLISGGRMRFVWYVLVAQPVGLKARLPGRLGREIIIRRAQPGDPLLAASPRPRGTIEERFAQGALCFAAVRGGALAGFLWVCPSRYVEDDVRCVFEVSNGTWWDFDVWVAHDHRNGVVLAKLWEAAHSFLSHEGASWTCSRITRQNSASLRAHRRIGALKVGSAFFVIGRQWQIAILPGLKVHVSTNPTSIPVIRVGPPRLVNR